MSKVLQNNKETISLGRVESFCLFVACSYTFMEATMSSCCFSWSVMHKVLWNNKSPISLEKVEWFCWYFAFSYLHLVTYPWKLQKYAILGWHCQTASQPIRLSDVSNLKNSKTIWGIKLSFCFHWSWKRYHVILGYSPKILLAN